MIHLVAQLDGDEWQLFVVQLLSLRYGADLIEVPDQHKGDSGIEAFSVSDGCAFQCYAPEGPSGNIAEVAKKHKKKISRDIKKFCENREELKALFGTTKIRRWILVVPEHCSAEVVKCCQQKTEEVRELSSPLSYITEDFQVVTVDGHKFFVKEVAELTRAGGLLREATSAAVPDEQVQLFSKQHDEWMDNLDQKLSKLHLTPPDQLALRDKLLRMHLEGGNALAYYDNNFPVISDQIRTIKQSRAKALEIDSKLQALTIGGTREKFETELVNSVPTVGRRTAMTLSYAAVAEWLMVCPLDPKG